ncbi:putative membrane protein [Brucella grignonensis]|uniref:Putative membrane protein n=2 Tax=Brucella grignonensis TaxID=94627 RepID=A0A256FNE6_9HYPH|nr:putative membrane protein [Brucella grignonensis]
MGISLCLSRLLIFASKFVQHPKKHKISYMHIGWVVVVFLWVIQFWWEYLFQSGAKSYNIYIYLLDLLYVFGLFFVCVTLTPDDIKEYGDYDSYFLSRKIWLFSLFIFLDLVQFLNGAGPQILINDRHSYVGEFIILVIETVAILFAMRLKRKGFQYFFITVLIAGVFADFTLQFD